MLDPRDKSETGLSHYDVRHRLGWHHHQALSLIATWFLLRDALRGKEWNPAIAVPQIRDGIALLLRAQYECNMPSTIAANKTGRLVRNEEASFSHHKARNRLPPLEDQATSMTWDRRNS